MSVTLGAVLVLSAATAFWVRRVTQLGRESEAETARLLAQVEQIPVPAGNAHAQRLNEAERALTLAGNDLTETLERWRTVLLELEATSAGDEETDALSTGDGGETSDVTLLSAWGPFTTEGVVYATPPIPFPNRPRSGFERRAPHEILGFDSDEELTLVVPTLWVPATETTASRWTVVTEDHLAVQAIDARLRASWPEAAVTTRVTDLHDERLPPAGNVCSFCRDRRNPVTAQLLGHQDTKDRFGFPIGFQALPTDAGRPQEWGLVFDREVLRSPSYDGERRLLASEASDSGPFPVEDFALVARFPNPWGNGHTLIVAGVRAIGTWGAAEYLRKHADEIEAETGGKAFAALLRVSAKYQRYSGFPSETAGRLERIVPVEAADLAPKAALLDLRPVA